MTQSEYEEARAEIMAVIEIARNDPHVSKDEANYVESDCAGALNDLENQALYFGLQLVDDPPLPSPYEDWPYPFVFQERLSRHV